MQKNTFTLPHLQHPIIAIYSYITTKTSIGRAAESFIIQVLEIRRYIPQLIAMMHMYGLQLTSRKNPSNKFWVIPTHPSTSCHLPGSYSNSHASNIHALTYLGTLFTFVVDPGPTSKFESYHMHPTVRKKKRGMPIDGWKLSLLPPTPTHKSDAVLSTSLSTSCM